MASILLIDDDNDLRSIIAMMLGASGHAVRQAADGSAGIRLYQQSPADVVITDVVMPEKEGLATIIELRKINPRVRIIAISGGFAFDSKLYLNMARKLGADQVLRKPFLPEELKAAVDSLLPPPAATPPA
ncbi:MAG: response regulator transcription factor [Opitutales bacterium]